MAATTIGGVVAKDKPLLDVKWLAFAFTIYTVFYAWVRWYEGVYGWSAGLDSFAPEFETWIPSIPLSAPPSASCWSPASRFWVRR